MFESSRIQLQKVEKEDVGLYHSWRNNLEVMYSTSPALDIYTLEETRHFFENIILGSSSSRSYMIVDKDSQKKIGITSLINIDKTNRNAECIIDIGEKEYWGKGYGREALTLLLDYSFLELNLHRISLQVFSFNERAVNLYKRIGFKEEGASREALFRNGQWHDIIHMGILQKEYISIKTTNS